jgi:hypothetical protein
MAVYFGEDLATKYALANTYYGVNSHIRTHDWAKETEADKKAALVQAEREINMYLATDMDTVYDDYDWPLDVCPNFRPDYAIFEHALYILDETVRTKEGTDGAKDIESDEYQEEEKTTGVGISPQATRFLKLNRIQACRG